MRTPYYAPFQFLDAAGFNTAAATVSGNLSSVVSGLFRPGLISPSGVALVYAGLGVTVNAPAPFQVLFGNGVVAAASGVITNAVSTSYAVNVSGLVPASGSVTAYLNVQYAAIQLNPYQVLGPPPGHPDYVPTFVPYTSYLTTADSLNFTVGTTPPDNFTTFEFGRATLATGATGVAFATTYQQQATTNRLSQILQVSGAVPITQNLHAGKTLVFIAAGTATLPLAASSNGMEVSFTSQTSGVVTIQTTGADIIYGSGPLGVAAASAAITQFGFASFQAQDGIWQLVAVSTNMASTGPLGLNDGGLKSANFNIVASFVYDCDNTAGTPFTALAPASAARGDSFALNVIGTNTQIVDWNGLVFQGDPLVTVIYPEGLYIFRYGVASRGWERSQ